jgi:triosephosphate isomerase
MPRIIVANWKMYGLPARVETLLPALIAGSQGVTAEVILCPPTPLLATIVNACVGTKFRVGAQDCFAGETEEGAYTGDVSAAMLKAYGCEAVIIGHSERRQYHHERPEALKAKLTAAFTAGLLPILCIGESLADRNAGRTQNVLKADLIACLPEAMPDSAQLIIAYEPLWAIGSGKTPTPEDIAEIADFIRQTCQTWRNGFEKRVSILYGGSINATNAKDILAKGRVDGALVGGASLQAETFLAVLEQAGSLA